MGILPTAGRVQALSGQSSMIIAQEGIRAIYSYLSATQDTDSKTFSQDLDRIQKRFCDAFPEEVLLKNALQHLLSQKTHKKQLKQHTVRFLEQLQKDQQFIIDIAHQRIPKGSTVLTYGYDATVEMILASAWEKKNISIISVEGQPVYGGKKLADALAQKNIPVHYFSDAAMSSAMGRADMVLLGAQRIHPQGDIIHQVGSKTIAHLAHVEHLPLYVCAHTLQADPRADHYLRKAHTADHIWEHAPSHIHIHTGLHEKIPSNRITGIISEKGLCKPTQLKNEIKKFR